MNKRRDPTLAEIEARWFTPSDALLAHIANNDPTVPEGLSHAVLDDPDYQSCVAGLRETGKEGIGTVAIVQTDIENCQPPAWLLELADKRDTARRQLRGAKIQPGSLVAVERLVGPDGELPIDFPSIAVALLDGEDDPGIWYGWLAASETAYATDWDFILREEDGPFDPSLAGMVQLWNPVRVYAKSIARIVGALPMERLNAVCALAAEYLTLTGPAERPAAVGSIYVRPTLHGFTVATGSPLQGPQDPRWHYQEIYLRVAEAVRKPARLALASRPWWAGLWDSIAASLQFVPSPAIACAMDGAPASNIQEGILAGRFRLRLDSDNANVIRLHLSRVGDKDGSVRLTRLGQTLQTLAVGQAEDVFSLDQRSGYALEILDSQGSLIERIELDGAE